MCSNYKNLHKMFHLPHKTSPKYCTFRYDPYKKIGVTVVNEMIPLKKKIECQNTYKSWNKVTGIVFLCVQCHFLLHTRNLVLLMLFMFLFL
jgi:hypothetical protein